MAGIMASSTGRSPRQKGPKRYIKYANRKLYDIAEARYASTRDVAQEISSGRTVQVCEADGGKDITFETAARALYERICDHLAAGGGEPFKLRRLYDLIRVVP